MAGRRPHRIPVAVLLGPLLLILAGCPVRPIYAPQYHGPTPPYYRVRLGDTLYSIGQRFGLDHEKIARWNGIRNPGSLELGQRLRLRPPRDRAERAKGAEGEAKAGAGEGASAAAPGPKPEGWQWPLEGRIITRFAGDDPRPNNGIDIAAPAGTEVRAVAGGRVVYSGDGLRGYGNLVIIRHSADYLTAYGYNRENLVAEDDKVEAGQVVARVGATGAAEESCLHFEVRRRTEPIDPLGVLPDR